MSLIKRLKEPTPSFWKKVQKVGIALGVIGGGIATTTITLPAIIVTIGGYLATVGIVTTALSQMTSTER